jgi:hypothetical protein
MSDWSDEETDDPIHADRRNFYKVEASPCRRFHFQLAARQPGVELFSRNGSRAMTWSRDGVHIDTLLCAGNNLDKVREIESLGPMWPERKAFVPAKARLWHTAAPVWERRPGLSQCCVVLYCAAIQAECSAGVNWNESAARWLNFSLRRPMLQHARPLSDSQLDTRPVLDGRDKDRQQIALTAGAFAQLAGYDHICSNALTCSAGYGSPASSSAAQSPPSAPVRHALSRVCGRMPERGFVGIPRIGGGDGRADLLASPAGAPLYTL